MLTASGLFQAVSVAGLLCFSPNLLKQKIFQKNNHEKYSIGTAHAKIRDQESKESNSTKNRNDEWAKISIAIVP